MLRGIVAACAVAALVCCCNPADQETNQSRFLVRRTAPLAGESVGDSVVPVVYAPDIVTMQWADLTMDERVMIDVGTWAIAPYRWPRAELIAESGDTVKVRLEGTPAGRIWTMWPRIMSDTWGPVNRDSLGGEGDTYDLIYSFVAGSGTKGYVTFEAWNEDRAFTIGLTIDPIDTLWYVTDSIEWLYSSVGASRLLVAVRGRTNAHGIGVAQLGTGIARFVPVAVHDSVFEDTVCIAYFHVAIGLPMTYDTKLHLYGTTGMPVEVHLKNPFE